MSLSVEWSKRIDWFIAELERHIYRPLQDIIMKGFITKEQLSLAEASLREFADMPPGTPWGAKWEYGWFRGEAVIPPEAQGRRLVVVPDVGGEGAVYINGRLCGAKDKTHKAITLTRSALPGERFEIVVESYAGHGEMAFWPGPTPPERHPMPIPGPTQVVTGRTSIGIWEEDAFQLFIDIKTIQLAADKLDEQSLRREELLRGLKEFTLLVDFEHPSFEERMKDIRECRRKLEPLMKCTNGSTAPELYVVGQSHIDIVWLWPLAETDRKIGRTLSTQLELMREYPDFKFVFSQPYLYDRLKTLYPELYQELKERVAEGRFIPEGGMWVEADTNLPSGESLIRQFLHGKRFFREEFGLDNRILWLPDVFGYSAALPQIMKGCGVHYFYTTKLLYNYVEYEPFPYNTFIWQGMDGSEVLAHIFQVSPELNPSELAERWRERLQSDLRTAFSPFGVGDGGGGPGRETLEFANRLKDFEGLPRIRMEHPLKFYQDVEHKGPVHERYVGELYYSAHRGTYTAQARTKQLNRRAEYALREAEIWSAAACVQAKQHSYPAHALDRLWKKVLLNQFHDILPGSSLTRGHRESEEDFREVIAEAQLLTKEAGAAIAGTDSSVKRRITAFNSLGWEREDVIELPYCPEALTDADGNFYPVQPLGDGEGAIAIVPVPSIGWRTFQPSTTSLKPGDSGTQTSSLTVRENFLENEFLRLTFNEFGEIISLYDKEAELELAAEPCNRLNLYKDITTTYDAWDIDSMYTDLPVELPESASIEIGERGPLRVSLRISRKINNSLLTQEVRLTRGSRRVDFVTAIDWQERHKLLKVAFPVKIVADDALHEIQFGHIKRPNHYNRPFDRERFEVCAHRWSALAEENRGFAVLNDSKYGVSVLGNTIQLTLLRAPLAPDPEADRGHQTFIYSILPWNGSFAESPVVRAGHELNGPVTVLESSCDLGDFRLFTVDAPNVILDTVKQAEDGSGDLILRFYESKRMTSISLLRTDLPVEEVWECTMLEEPTKACDWDREPYALEFRPFEIKTLRLRIKV